MLNLWDPHRASLAVALVTAFLLGLLHGVTPDEHTWPITFSYSIGSYSTRGGLRAGLTFSAGFTLQRALASQLAFFLLTKFLASTLAQDVVYVVVGAVMVLSGYYVRQRGRALHLMPWLERLLPTRPDRPVPLELAFLHGVIAGWGTGAFATILYTVLAPAMPSAWLGFVPGLLFGMGTAMAQALVGAAFGWWLEHRRLGDAHKAFVGRYVSGNTLFFGGTLFVLTGLLGLAFPALGSFGIATGIHVHNLDQINLGLVLVVVVVAGIGGSSLWRALQLARTGSRPLA
jgi:hypothetical protein